MECRWKEKQGGYRSNSGEDKMVPLTGMIKVQVVRNKSDYSCTWRVESNKSQCGSRPIMQRVNREICLHHFQLACYKTLNFFSMIILSILSNKTSISYAFLHDECQVAWRCMFSFALFSLHLTMSGGQNKHNFACSFTDYSHFCSLVG